MKTITNIEMFPVSFDGGSWQETLQRYFKLSLGCFSQVYHELPSQGSE